MRLSAVRAVVVAAIVAGFTDGAELAERLEHHHHRPRHHRGDHRHLRHGRHHPRHRVPVALTWTKQYLGDAGVDDLLDHPEQPEMINGVESYKIHPLVGRQLTHMTSDLRDLEATKSVADTDQQKLADVRDDATTHMNQGGAVKRDMARTEAALRKTQQMLAHLEGEGAHIEHDHDKLMTTLKGVMEPKIQNAEDRVEKRSKGVSNYRQTLETWEGRQKKYKAAAMLKLEERRSMADGLRLADDTFAKAQQSQEVAQNNFEKARKEAGKEVEAYRYVETRFQAVQSQLSDKVAEVRQEEKSLSKMKSVFHFESERVDQAGTMKQEQLKQLVQATQAQVEQEKSEETLLKKKYDDWKDAERERAAVVSQRKEAYKAALDSYKEKRADVYTKAQVNAAKTANHDADWTWDDWAWSGDDGSDPTDEEVHLTD